MSITSIHQCRNLKAMVDYCITPKKGQESERVGSLYSDLGNSELFLKYGADTLNIHNRKVQGYTILQSFPKHEFDVQNQEHIETVNELGRKLSYTLYPNSPCLVITHADSNGECLHNHILVLNHDLQSDGCIKENRHYKYVKQVNDNLMRAMGLEVCKPSTQKQTQGEYWSNKRNNWLEQLKESVNKALSHATSISEFQNNLLIEGVSLALYKANGALKEKFTYTVMDDDGKPHKKRSDKLGENYSRQAIEQILLLNKHKREQQAIMPMSEWIKLQKEKERNDELLQPKVEAKPIPQTDILGIYEKPHKRETGSPVDTEREKEMKKEIISQALKREKEHQELLKELDTIKMQIKLLEKKFDEETDTNEDFETLNELYAKSDKIKIIIKNFDKKYEVLHSSSNEKLNENLLPQHHDISKDYGLSR